MEVIDGFENRALDRRSEGLRRLMGTRESSQAWVEARLCRLEPGSDSGSKQEQEVGLLEEFLLQRLGA